MANRFKARMTKEFEEEHQDWIKQWLGEFIDADGYVHGYSVGSYIVGDVMESTDEYVVLEYWVPIEEHSILPEKPEEQANE
ncbi:hypothetical protein VXN63_02275 [Marinilactibacillus sp. XAAS-LB27]|uniref:hypothetical protein n=1 Tax=Marinilactibacillus sp. XAAS-LB27 TaxID=3114538 RepID=UPI002E18231A|nr:hypothetical protein [Marinilactibacillus sp. XAAS-LB27]